MRRVEAAGLSGWIPVCVTLWVLLSLCSPLLAQQRLALQTRAAAPVGIKLVGSMPNAQRLSLALTLSLRNQEQLHTLLQQLEDPTNPNYHRYLSSPQFTEQFGPTFAEYQQVIAFAQSYGLTVPRTSPSRLLLNVTGSVGNIDRAFHVTMGVYQHPTENRTFYAPDVEPTADAGVPLLGVSGLTNFTLPHSMLVHASSDGGMHSDQTGSGPGGQFYGSDMRTAYYGAGPLTGSGQALALAELGQYNAADVQAYFTAVGQPLNVPIVLELLGGTSGVCPGNCNDGEEAIDIQQIISMAPGASVLIVYEDVSGNADVDIFDAYSTENVAKQMSFSFGIGDGNSASDEQYFAKFHAQGQNFFVASGDAGPYVGTSGWPGYSQNVTDVGGTDLTTNGAGGPWEAETAWIGSGSGWCDNTVSGSPCSGNNLGLIPNYQTSAINASNQGSPTFRDIVDVSAEANTDNFFCSSGTCQGGIGGTSLAAPRWAGFLALANEQAAANGDTIGFLNPTVYAIGQGPNYLHDITTGYSEDAGDPVTCKVGTLGCLNGSQPGEPTGVQGFNAVTGYDLPTGWGTPNGPGTIAALAPTSSTNPFFTLSSSPATLDLTPGGPPLTATISLSAANGFTGTVNLTNPPAIIGAPAGVTATVSPTSITGSETATLTVSTTSATPGGSFMVAVSGASTAGVQAQPALVTLALPDFSLTVTPSTAYPNLPNTIYVNQSSTAASAVTINSQNNFGGTVALSVSGFPSGVTGSFSPPSTASSSTLTLSASSTAATAANDYLSVSGTSGGISPLNAPYTILSVSAATGNGGSGTPVNLSSAYNLPGIYADGVTFGTGLDGSGFGYSAALLTPNRILNGVQFNFGPANATNCGGTAQPACANDAISSTGQTIALPGGQFTTLQLLATGIDGPLLSQSLTVTYTDGTTSAFRQSFSDWYSGSGSTPGPGQQPGESFAVVMPYRDEATGAQDNRGFNLYSYIFLLNATKTVQSLTLPNNHDVIVLAATLTTQSLGTQVSLASEYNIAGLFSTGTTFEGTGDIDGTADTNACSLPSGCSDAYSAQQVGLSTTTPATLTVNGLVFNFGTVNTANCGTGLPACIPDVIDFPAAGLTIPVPVGQQAAYTTLTLLGTAVQGSHTGTVTVTYTTGSPATFNQTFSDWCNFGSNQYESVAVGGISRLNSDGTLNTQASCHLYAYTYPLDSTRTAQSVTLTYTGTTAGGAGAFAFALTLSGNTTTTAPGFTLSANPSSLSVAQGSSNTSTITVNPTGGFTGTVNLAVSGLPSGVTGTFTSTGATTSTLTLTASASAPTGGPTTVTVTGTSGTLAPQNATIAVTLTAPVAPGSYSLSAGTASSAVINPGASSTAAVTVTPANGYTGSVTLTCTVTSTVTFTAAQAICSAGPNPVLVTANETSPPTSTLTFTTQGPSGALIRRSSMFYALWLPLPGLALLGLGARGSRRKKLLGFLLFGIVLASLIVLPACGSSSTSSGGGGGNPGTPAGTYTLTITGKDANGLTQSNTALTVSVTVN